MSARVREKCFTIIRVRFRRALWVERADDKKFGRVIWRLNWRIIRARAIYFYPRANGIKSPRRGGKETGRGLRRLLMRNRNPNGCVWKKGRVLRSAVDKTQDEGRRRATERTNEVTRRESVAVIPLKLEGCYCDYRFRTNLQLDRPRRPFMRVFFLALGVGAIYSAKKLHAWNLRFWKGTGECFEARNN